jgi:transcription elongation factor GreA
LTVVIEEVDSGESRRISIVGEDESDIDRGMISVTAPLGRALIGKEVGDIARVNAPGGAREYEVMEIMIDYTEEEEADGAQGEEPSNSEA